MWWPKYYGINRLNELWAVYPWAELVCLCLLNHLTVLVVYSWHWMDWSRYPLIPGLWSYQSHSGASAEFKCTWDRSVRTGTRTHPFVFISVRFTLLLILCQLPATLAIRLKKRTGFDASEGISSSELNGSWNDSLQLIHSKDSLKHIIQGWQY